MNNQLRKLVFSQSDVMGNAERTTMFKILRNE